MVKFQKMRLKRGKQLQDQHEALQAAASDPEVCLMYDPGTRNYGIYIVNQAIWKEFYSHGTNNEFFRSYTARIDYCPWSGRVLPGNLKHARSKVLKEEYGIYLPYWGNPKLVDLPDGFYGSEEWWVTRQIDRRRRPKVHRPHVPEGYYMVRYHFLLKDPKGTGKYRSREKPAHLCRNLSDAMEDIRVMICYIPWTREYGIRRLAVDRLKDEHPVRMVKIDFCPWCGEKLPDSLKQEWQRQIAIAGHSPNDEDLPGKFLTDTWWKEAGL
jgi:hypothetical protein|tara:strand:- start:259 stop:1062 length:804 start_codon:yes stop_codon:yes gene_type:complete